MTIEWTQHRFSGGALALDVANTVVMRHDPARGFDRFDDPDELPHFCAAASRFRADELGGGRLTVADPRSARPTLIALREATDALFREAARQGRVSEAGLPDFLRACADNLEQGRAGAGGVPLQSATACSALGLLAPDKAARIRICDNCGWLFLDGSRNGSRRWCDMAVCGNRRKARRHYERRARREAHP